MVKKKYIKSRKTYQITFEVSKSELPADTPITTMAVLGDFNQWDSEANLMTRNKKGAYRATIELEPNQEIEFRYLANGSVWLNDEDADACVANEYGGENCILRVE